MQRASSSVPFADAVGAVDTQRVEAVLPREAALVVRTDAHVVQLERALEDPRLRLPSTGKALALC